MQVSPDLDSMVPGQALTIEGVRQTRGNAVDCPQLQLDSGVLVSVHGLAADVAIGERVRVSGTMAPVTTCSGLVLVANDVVRLPQGEK